jgi:hypothetical protein
MNDQHKSFDELTAEELKELKIEFAPGCFDQFDGTQEELDQLINEIKQSFADGSIHEQARQLTEEDFDELPEESKQQLARFLLDPEDQHLIPGNDRRLQ